MLCWRAALGYLALGLAMDTALGAAAIAQDAVMNVVAVVPVKSADGVKVEFPLVVLPPSLTDVQQAEAGDLIFVQPLRSVEVLRIKESVRLNFKPLWKDAIDVEFPAGTLFVKATVGSSEYHCASRLGTPWGFSLGIDVGLCLSDAEHDGTFENLVVVENPGRRIRSPYELFPARLSRPTQPVHVAYEKVDKDAIPRLELRVRFSHEFSVFGRTYLASLGVCWPAALTIPNPAKHFSVSCALTDWPGPPKEFDPQDAYKGWYRLSGDHGRIEWGPVAIAFSKLPDNKISARVENALPAGNATLSTVGYLTSFDFANQIQVMSLEATGGKSGNPQGGT